MESLPVLVTRLPDRRALARLLRAALRHEVAQVALTEPPRQGTHTLDLRVGGSPAVSLLAELAGAPQANGQFPLRLRPLHRAQAAELYALLEADPASSSGSAAHADPPQAGRVETHAQLESAAPVSPPPDTEAHPRTLAYEPDSAPIARAMSGSAPPVAVPLPAAGEPIIDPKVTARLDWTALQANNPRIAPAQSSVPRTTARSLEWSPPAKASASEVPPSADAPRTWTSSAPPPPLVDDPRRTTRSAGWLPPRGDARPVHEPSVIVEDGAAADDPSLSVSVVFEPDALPAAVAAAALRAGHRSGDDAGPADVDEPSLSVSVVFEPEALAAMHALDEADRAPISAPVSTDGDVTQAVIGDVLGPNIGEDLTQGDVSGSLVVSAAVSTDESPMGDSFFDDALANLPMVPADLEGNTMNRASGSEVPPTEAEGRLYDDPTGATPVTPMGPDMQAAVARISVPPPPDDDDDDADTLIRLPGSASIPPPGRAAPLPAAGRPAREPHPEEGVRAESEPRPPRPAEDVTLTPTQNNEIPRAKRGTTGHGKRKKHTSRQGKPSERDLPANASESRAGAGLPVRSDDSPRSSRSGRRRTRHPADGESPTVGSYDDPNGRARERDDGDPLLGRKIAEGKYLIESLIGEGAAGAVYKATHRDLRRSVAIKVLHPHYQHDPHFMKSFRGEALAASQLDHPNVMRVLDFGQEPSGLVYIVMEYLSGRTLQNLLDEERRLQMDRAVEIMIQVCAALSVAHDNQIIHRDIKPDNIMLVPSRNDEGGSFELVKVCDFGIAALQNPREDPELGETENIIAGTPEYMSPEQARGAELDARADVYACGICLYELVTGRPPFLGDNAAEILIKQLEEPPRAPSQLVRGLDSLLEEIILRAIQKDPAKRQQSARELRAELKEVIDPADAGAADDDDERSIVENVPVLDDPASGFPGFFIALSSSILRFGRFERGHPEAPQAMKELLKSTKAALRGRRELTFARRDAAKALGYCVMTGHGEIAELRRLLGSQLYGSFGHPFVEALVQKGIAAMTLREGLPDAELQYLIEMLLGPHGGEDLRKELMSKPLRHLSVLFVADVVGRDRKLSWKVGLCAARLSRDLRALSNLRGISLKKMREIREDLVLGVAHLLTKGDEVRQFLFNADLVDETVANLRGFSGFQVAPLVFERLLHEPCVDAVALLLQDLDQGELDQGVLKGYLRAFAQRLLGERSPKSDAAVAELYRRKILEDADVPRDLQEQIRASSLAEGLIRDPSQFLRALDFIQDADDYGREMATLEAAMAVLARRAEAAALLAAVGTLARHAKGNAGKPGARENHALRAMKSMIDKQRLVPIANALLVGPPHQREAARQLLVLAGSAGAHALYAAREATNDPQARPMFVTTFRETGPAGWSLLSAALPRLEVNTESDITFAEDLLRSVPDRPDAALGDAVAKFLGHPRLRPVALAAIVPLWGERARKPLLDAVEFAEEPARLVALAELRRARWVDEHVVNVIERLLTMKGSAGEELRAAAAAALADSAQTQRTRVIQFLSKAVEAKRGLVAMIRGEGGAEESALVTESMARALLALDRAEGARAIKSRVSRAEGPLRQRLTALLS
ncbi:MAG: protein kinase [Deltaproteobacteria bacterium]|nr:protein kinase [Deltaproteobacteria bacterium]